MVAGKNKLRRAAGMVEWARWEQGSAGILDRHVALRLAFAIQEAERGLRDLRRAERRLRKREESEAA